MFHNTAEVFADMQITQGDHPVKNKFIVYGHNPEWSVEEIRDIQNIAVAYGFSRSTQIECFNIYQGVLTRLIKKPEDITVISSLSGINHMVHMYMGLSGEYLEFLAADSPENVVEELGDMLFYATGLVMLNTRTPNKCFSETEVILPIHFEKEPCENLLPPLTLALDSLLNGIKKFIIYKNGETDDIDGETESIVTNAKIVMQEILVVAYSLGYTATDLMLTNLKKLNKRYPGLTYENKAALNRADKQE